MSREIQKRNRELKNALSLLLKECPKVYKSQKVKKIDYMLWITKNQMIYSFFPTVRVQENNNKPILRVQIEYKPIWVDNLLWDILGMEENKKSPDSLKVIGAFTARCAE